jgi:Rod binding domain-containing protein
MNVPSLQSRVAPSDVAPEQLAGNKALSEQDKIGEASRQFEALLLRQILQETQKPVVASKFSDTSTAGGIYRDMVTGQLADAISKSGSFGLAKTFERQLSHPAHQPKAAHES